MISDSFFFNDYEEVVFGVIFDVKTRLTKYLDKKTGKFLYWSIDVKEKVSNKNDSENIKIYCSLPIVKAESAIFDYTEDGSFFGLTDSQKERALEKRINQ